MIFDFVCGMSDAMPISARSSVGSSGFQRSTGSTAPSVASRATPGFSGGRVCVMAITRSCVLLGGLLCTGMAILVLVVRRGLVLVCWVEVAEFDPGVVGGELPVDLALVGVGGVLPGCEFGVEEFEFTEAAVQALAGQR